MYRMHLVFCLWLCFCVGVCECVAVAFCYARVKVHLVHILNILSLTFAVLYVMTCICHVYISVVVLQCNAMQCFAMTITCTHNNDK